MGASASKSVTLEMKLKRPESGAFLDRLSGRSGLRVNVRRARVTAREAWMLIEISGRERDVDEALRITRTPAEDRP